MEANVVAGAQLPAVSYAVDLRAEVLARPTTAMWTAMQKARIGWYGLEQDENVAELERRIASLTGKEAAFMVATGAVANLLAVMSLAGRATQVVMERRCHIYWHEENGAALIMGIATRLLDGGRFGKIDAAELAAALDERYGFGQVTSLVCLENTHSIAGGCALTPQDVSELATVAKAHGAQSVYVDGARLWNAAVALDVTLEDLLVGVDAAMVSLNKGLGAPVGAVLVGTEEFIRRARRHAKQLGVYSVHRMGFFAAAALQALEDVFERTAEDHRRAQLLAEGLNRLSGLSVDMETVQTNIVRVDVTADGLDARGFIEGLRQLGVGGRVIEPPRTVKFSTYSEITDDDIAVVVGAAAEALSTASTSFHAAV